MQLVIVIGSVVSLPNCEGSSEALSRIARIGAGKLLFKFVCFIICNSYADCLRLRTAVFSETVLILPTIA